jgi:hypothetical protein
MHPAAGSGTVFNISNLSSSFEKHTDFLKLPGKDRICKPIHRRWINRVTSIYRNKNENERSEPEAPPHRLTSPITIQRPSQITPRILNFVSSGHRQVIQGNKIHTYITHISSRLPHPPSLRSENQSTITSQLRHHGSVGLQRIAGD